jgi:hypothetical protein
MKNDYSSVWQGSGRGACPTPATGNRFQDLIRSHLAGVAGVILYVLLHIYIYFPFWIFSFFFAKEKELSLPPLPGRSQT